MQRYIKNLKVKMSICLAAITLLSGCLLNEKSPDGFRLPEGASSKGKTAFIDLGCIQCHLVAGEEVMPVPSEMREISIVLGGEIRRVKTYGQLVTSIINPSHVIDRQYRDKYTNADGKSKMPDFSEEMTVRQMIDIAEFLQSKYEVVVPNYAFDDFGY